MKMKIKQMGTTSDGTRSFEIRCETIGYRGLIHAIRKIPGAVVIYTSHDPMNDDTNIVVEYKGITINIGAPFSDYIVECSSNSKKFDEFIEILKNHPVKWWEWIF